MAVRDESVGLPELAFVPNRMASDVSGFAGQALLVNLWATWCAPCREEMPALMRCRRTRVTTDFKVLAINIDTGDDAKPKAFLDEIGVSNLGLYRDASIGVFNTLKKEGLAFRPSGHADGGQGWLLLGAMNGPAEWAGEDAKALTGALKGI
jgi:hypothetical protein